MLYNLVYIWLEKNSPFTKTIPNTFLNYVKITLSKKKKRILEIMTWSSQSPYLSPIESFREELDWRIQRECLKNES